MVSMSGCYIEELPSYSPRLSNILYSLQRNQFLRTGRVNSNTRIEISLPCAHLNRHSETLHHLATPSAQNMHPHNLLIRPLTNELILRWLQFLLLLRVEIVKHRREFRVVYLYIFFPEFGYGCGLCHANGADFGVGEDDGGDVAVV